MLNIICRTQKTLKFYHLGLLLQDVDEIATEKFEAFDRLFPVTNFG